MLEQIHVLCSRKTYNNHTGRSRPNTDNASRMRQIFCFNSFSFCAHKRKTTTYIASVRVVLPRSAISGSAPASKGSVPRANMVPASCRSSLEGGGGCWRGAWWRVARGVAAVDTCVTREYSTVRTGGNIPAAVAMTHTGTVEYSRAKIVGEDRGGGRAAE